MFVCFSDSPLPPLDDSVAVSDTHLSLPSESVVPIIILNILLIIFILKKYNNKTKSFKFSTIKVKNIIVPTNQPHII